MAPESPGEDWSRLHPLSPLLRGGRLLAVVIAGLAGQGLRSPEVLGWLLGVGAPTAVLYAGVAWRTTRYRLTPTELQVRSGVLQRRDRRVPLARLQSVDVVRPLVGRVLGLAELRLEVAGGADTEAPLAYLADADAQRLRMRLLARAGAAGAGAGAAQADDDDEEAVLVTVPTGALVTSVLLSVPALLTLVVLLGVVPVGFLRPRAVPGLLATLTPLLLGTVSQGVRRLLSEYDFTVAESPDGLRLRHGLLETRAQTIPLDRVQAVRVVAPLLWRRRGWVRVEVDVAGYASGRGEQSTNTSALLPVGPEQLALALVDRVLRAPLPAADRPAPPAARWRAPLSARRLRVGLSDAHLVATSGVVTTTTDVVPLAKVQSLRLVQGPWQRRLGLASVTVDTAGRRLPRAVARHRGRDDAEALLEALTDGARRARRPKPMSAPR